MNSLNKTYDRLDTPCGEISIFDPEMNRIPFKLEANGYNVPYNVDWQSGGEKNVTTPDNYAIVVDPKVLKTGCTYKLILRGLTLQFGDSDEHTECVSGSSGQYCIAIGAYDPNDDEKIHQQCFSGRFPVSYDESKFVEYGVEMLPDCSGFEFCRLDNTPKQITFLVAWIKCEPGKEVPYTEAVEFWTT